MAYANHISVITDKMKECQIRFFTILDADNRTVLDHQDDEDKTVDDAITKVQAFADRMQGTVYIVLRDKSRNARKLGGNHGETYKYQVTLGSQGVRNGNVSGFSGLAEILQFQQQVFELRLESVRKDYQHENEVKELKEKLEEGEDSMMEMLKPFLVSIAANLKLPQQMKHGIAGVNDQPISQNNIDVTERLNNAISRIIAIDPDFVEHLEDLANYAERDPKKFLSFLPMIKNL